MATHANSSSTKMRIQQGISTRDGKLFKKVLFSWIFVACLSCPLLQNVEFEDGHCRIGWEAQLLRTNVSNLDCKANRDCRASCGFGVLTKSEELYRLFYLCSITIVLFYVFKKCLRLRKLLKNLQRYVVVQYLIS